MTNSFYNPSGNPGTGAPGASLTMRNEFTSIQTAFNYFPAFTGNSGKALIVNAPGTAYDLTTGALALGGNLTITGANSTNFVAGANVNLTLPIVDGTLAMLASPAFTGNPTSPTPSPGDNDTSIATTAFVVASFAPLASPAFTGTPTAPTATAGTSTTQIATTAFVTTSFAPLASPALTGNPTAPTPASGDNDTSIATTAFVVAASAVTTQAAADNVGRNLVDNSLFNVAQRGAGPWTTHGAYTLDRWQAVNIGAGTFTIVQSALSDADRSGIGDEAAAFCLTNNFTGGATAGSYHYVTEYIENVRRLAGKTVTVSFWANATATFKLGVNLLQVFGTGGSPSTAVWALATGGSVTIPGTTFARYSVTIPVPSIAGKTLGTNGDDCTGLAFWYSSGATNNALAGNIGVQTGLINIWGVLFEIGSVVTPLEKPNPQQDVAKCQRFYQTVMAQARVNASVVSQSVSAGVYWSPMRTTPTAALITTGTRSNVGSVALIPANPNGGRLDFTSTGAGDAYVLDELWSLSADL